MAFFTSSGPKFQQLSNFTPQQLGVKGAASNQALQMLQGLGGGKGPGFEPIAQHARTQFQTNTIPGLAERFTSLGQGSQRSSAFQGALGQAGSELEQGLAALGSEFGQRQQGLDQNLLQLLLGNSLQPEFQTVQTSEGGQPSGFMQLMQFLQPLLASFGPAGAGAGAGLKALSSYLSGL